VNNCAPGDLTAPSLRLVPAAQCETGPQPPFLQWPPELAGFEDEQAVDPATNMIYATSQIVPLYTGYFGLNASTYFSSTGMGGVPCPTCGTLYNNATVWGINAANGAIVWHYNIPNQGYRGVTTVSGNLVYVTLSSGDILMLNAQTGQLVRDYYIGAPMAIGLSIGATTNGQENIMVPVGTCNFVDPTCPGSTPGDIVALNLQNVPTQTVSVTTTTTSTTTTTTTSVSVSTAPAQTVTTTTTLANGQVSTITTTLHWSGDGARQQPTEHL